MTDSHQEWTDPDTGECIVNGDSGWDGTGRQLHGPTLFVPADNGTVYDVVEVEAFHYLYDRSGVPPRGPVDGVTGERPEPDDYRDLAPRRK